ncbi:MAG: hypothetical protein CMJ39_01275, partial [Phycisphaerae bacterium]|nr:hypothetical protein [Phycisphaerae bacterium]
MKKSPRCRSFVSSGLLLFGLVLAGCSTANRTVTTQVNQFTSSSQDHVAVAVDELDRVLVVWDSRRQQDGRY